MYELMTAYLNFSVDLEYYFLNRFISPSNRTFFSPLLLSFPALILNIQMPK